MGLKRVMWVQRYQGQCRALRPLGHQGYRLRSHNKDQPLCSGYTASPRHCEKIVLFGGDLKHKNQKSCEKQLTGPFSFIFNKTDCPGK